MFGSAGCLVMTRIQFSLIKKAPLTWFFKRVPLLIGIINLKIEKQSPGGVLLKRCSWKLRKIHRKTPVPVSFLIKLQVGPQLY